MVSIGNSSTIADRHLNIYAIEYAEQKDALAIRIVFILMKKQPV